jgi:hypothetical protein
MNLRNYFARIREAELSIKEPFTHVTSVRTSNGGREGQVTEVPREDAAKMFVDGVARPATEEEIEAFSAKQNEEREKITNRQLEQRVQIAVIQDPRVLRKATRASKAKKEE